MRRYKTPTTTPSYQYWSRPPALNRTAAPVSFSVDSSKKGKKDARQEGKKKRSTSGKRGGGGSRGGFVSRFVVRGINASRKNQGPQQRRQTPACCRVCPKAAAAVNPAVQQWWCMVAHNKARPLSHTQPCNVCDETTKIQAIIHGSAGCHVFCFCGVA